MAGVSIVESLLSMFSSICTARMYTTSSSLLSLWQGHRRFGVCRLVSTVYRTVSAYIRVFFPLFLLHFLGLRYRGGSQHGDRGELDQAGDAQSFSIQTRVQRAFRQMYHS